MSADKPASGASRRLHWHLVVRHKHPEWHGHCDLRFHPVTGHSCGWPHWHFLFRHRHSEDGR